MKRVARGLAAVLGARGRPATEAESVVIPFRRPSRPDDWDETERADAELLIALMSGFLRI